MSREHLEFFLPLPTSHIVGKMHMSSKCTQHVITGFQVPLPPVCVSGKLFTYLPLPSDTYYPCSIHTPFALMVDRQTLRNEKEEGLIKGAVDQYVFLSIGTLTYTNPYFSIRVEWNRYLFDAVVPEAWTKLLLDLSKLNLRPFSVWPSMQHVPTGRWAPFSVLTSRFKTRIPDVEGGCKNTSERKTKTRRKRGGAGRPREREEGRVRPALSPHWRTRRPTFLPPTCLPARPLWHYAPSGLPCKNVLSIVTYPREDLHSRRHPHTSTFPSLQRHLPHNLLCSLAPTRTTIPTTSQPLQSSRNPTRTCVPIITPGAVSSIWAPSEYRIHPHPVYHGS